MNGFKIDIAVAARTASQVQNLAVLDEPTLQSANHRLVVHFVIVFLDFFVVAFHWYACRWVPFVSWVFKQTTSIIVSLVRGRYLASDELVGPAFRDVQLTVSHQANGLLRFPQMNQ